jgi:hypothetical protein
VHKQINSSYGEKMMIGVKTAFDGAQNKCDISKFMNVARECDLYTVPQQYSFFSYAYFLQSLAQKRAHFKETL